MATQHELMERRLVLDDYAEETLNVHDIIAIILSGKWWIIAFLILSILVALAYLYKSPPVYEANVLLQVEDNSHESASQNQLQQMARMITGGATPADTQIEIIRSRSVLGRAVREVGLNNHAFPLYFPFIGEAIARHARAPSGPVKPWPILRRFGLVRYAWGGERIKLGSLTVPEARYGTRFTLVATGQGRYRLETKNGKPVLQGEVGSVAQSVDGRIKILVAQLVARPGEHFIVSKSHWANTAESVEQRLSVSEKGTDTGIIEMTLTGRNPRRTQRTLNKIADVFLGQNLESRSAQVQQSLSFIEAQLPKLRQQLNQAETSFANYRQKHEAVDLSGQGQQILKQMIAVEQNIATLKLKRSEYAELYTSKHPKVRALENQVATLEAEKSGLEKRIANLPQKQKEVLQMKRAIGVSTQIYTNLLDDAQQLKIIKAATVGSVRIVDHAVLPSHPVAPRRKQTMVIATLLGLFAGVGFVFLRRMLRRKVVDPKEVEERLNLPAYAVIPHSSSLARTEERALRRAAQPQPLLAVHHPQDAAAESLRCLRTRLYLAFMESQRKIIVVTGPGSGVGKSFVTMNLGFLVGSSGQSVVVVDGDLRGGNLHEYAGVKRSPGFSDVLAGTAALDGVLQPLCDDGAMLLPSGTVPRNPSELLMKPRCREILSELERRFDVVVIDTPPVMSVTDAAILAAHAGATLMVVRSGLSRMPEIQEAVKRLWDDKLNITGFVFNDFRPNTVISSYSTHAYPQYR